MAEQQILSKSQLLDALRASADEAKSTLRDFPPERWEEGRYENGWNSRQILAHLASIEWTYPRLVERARHNADGPPKETPSGQSSGQGWGRGSPQVNDYNARQVEKRANSSIDELMAEFEKNRSATIAAIQDAEDQLLTVPITSAGGSSGPLATVMHFVAVEHVLGHVHDIVQGSSE